MAIKFYRAKALPSSLNSSHDGVWFIKPDGATSFRTYNVKDGVAVGDGFEDLEIGGRNLLIGSKTYLSQPWRVSGATANVTYSVTKGTPIDGSNLDWSDEFLITSDGQSARRLTLTKSIGFPSLSDNQEVTISFWFENLGQDKPTLWLHNGLVNMELEGSGFYSQTAIVSSLTQIRIYNYDNPSGDLHFKISGLKLEKGNKATDWTPAPEDKVDVTDYVEVPQSEAQAGTSTTRRAWSALRVRQAITAWWNTIVDTIAERAWVSANFDKYGFWNLKTNGIQRKTIQSGNDVDFVAGNNMKVDYGAGGQVIFNATNTQYNSMSLPQLQAGTDTQQRVVSAKLLNDWFESQFAPRVIVDERYPQPFISQQGIQWGDASEPVWIAGHYLKKGSMIKIEHLSHPADANFMHQFTLGIAIDDDVQFAITDPLMRINPDDIFTTTYIEMYFVEDNEFVVRTVKYIKSNNFREITGGDILTVVSNQSVPIPEDGFELKIKSRGAHSNYILLSLSCRVTFEPSYVKV